MAKLKRGPKSFESKVRDLDENFVEEALLATPEKLNAKLVELTKYRIELDDAKENDMDLKRAQEDVKEAGAQYTEGFKAIKMKQKYIFNLLSNQGLGGSGTVSTPTPSLKSALKSLKKSLGDDAEITVTLSDGKNTTEATL